MASPVHLKVTYHNIEGRLVIVNTDVDEENRVKEIMQKDLLTSVVALEAKIKGDLWDPVALNLEAHKDEFRPVPDGNFEFAQLRDNPSKSVL